MSNQYFLSIIATVINLYIKYSYNIFTIMINPQPSPKLFVVDNFYANPDEVRNLALNTEYAMDLRYYKGYRSTRQWIVDGTKEAFESIMGQKIVHFNEVHSHCGRFQYTTAADPQVYHHDLQRWAAMIYLTPDAPLQSGTNLLSSKITGARHADDHNSDGSFNGGFLDGTKFDIADSVANVYNRLVIMDARCFHAAGPYFGQTIENARLIHLFFFD